MESKEGKKESGKKERPGWPVRTLGVRNSKGKEERESLKEGMGDEAGRLPREITIRFRSRGVWKFSSPPGGTRREAERRRRKRWRRRVGDVRSVVVGRRESESEGEWIGVRDRDR